jgi:hypothetical protein
MTRTRARNLDDAAIADIVAILDGWTGKLSWELLVDAIERRKHARYTRQGLDKHERIKHAFALRKKAIAEAIAAGRDAGVPDVESPELQAALERIARLEAENARVEAENQRLLGQFACWAYNAHTRGLDKVFLSRPLPAVNRDQTARPLKAVKPSAR